MEREHNILDRMLKFVPGYVGYASREERRQSDAGLREKIAALLRQCENSLNAQLAAGLASDSTSAFAVEHCRKRVNTLYSQVRYAPYGVSSFMNKTEIKEQELQQIMTCDMAILEIVIQLADRIHDLNPQDMNSVLNRIDSALEDRNTFIREFK